MPTSPQPCPCEQRPASESRRKVIAITAVGLSAPWSFVEANGQGPQAGDALVEEDAEGAPKPLLVSDLRPGKPLLAFPFDAKAGKARSEVRLNKLVLMKFNEADLPAALKARAAGGVIAYSAICTHQACDVKTWLSKEQALVCFCHSSKFQVLDDAKVVGGPATRPLPFLPLKLDGDKLVVAGAFSAAPGGTS
jgi:rieske iron-sulfur protein